MMDRFRKNIITIFALSVLITLTVSTQEYFVSRKGEVKISFKYNDSIISAKSNDVIVKLDYHTAKADMYLEEKNLITGIDSIDAVLFSSGITIHLNADLGIDYIDTKIHPVQEFTFSGTLYFTKDKLTEKLLLTNLIGTGRLEHISDESDNLPACLMTLRFLLQPDKLNSVYPYDQMKDFIKVELIQSILKPN